MDPQSQRILQGIVRREGRSLLQYLSDAFPWTTINEGDALARVQQFVKEERESTAALVRFLQRRRVTPPYFGAYPMSFTTLNFITLDHLLPLLVDAERKAIAALESDLARVTDPEARNLLQGMVEMKRGHEKALEEMAAAHPEPAAR